MNKRKILHALIAISLILTSNATVLADPLSDLLKEKQEQEQRLQQERSILNNSEDKLQPLEVAIEKLDVQIEKLMREIEENNAAIVQGKQAIIEAENEAKKTEEDITTQQALYDQRIRTIYKSGTNGYIQMIFEADSLNDFITRADAVVRIIQFDKNVIKSLEEKKEALKQKQVSIELENKRLASLSVENEKKLGELNESKNSQLPYIVQAREERARQEATVKEIRDKLNAVTSRISTMYDSASKYQSSRGSGQFSTDNVVIYAYNFIGTKYVYGGTSPNPGFDCSGFTRYVYAHFGIYLPRTSDEQFRTGTSVSRDSLVPGDLVFFGEGGDVSHVGIYVGDGCYIHSPQTGDFVKISVLRDNRYMGARRVR